MSVATRRGHVTMFANAHENNSQQIFPCHAALFHTSFPISGYRRCCDKGVGKRKSHLPNKAKHTDLFCDNTLLRNSVISDKVKNVSVSKTSVTSISSISSIYFLNSTEVESSHVSRKFVAFPALESEKIFFKHCTW